MIYVIVVLLMVIATALIQIAERMPEKPRAEWKDGKWNGVQ